MLGIADLQNSRSSEQQTGIVYGTALSLIEVVQ